MNTENNLDPSVYIPRDNEISTLIKKETLKHRETSQLIAAENITSREVLDPLSSFFGSKTTEEIPDKRYHAGYSAVDDFELLSKQQVCKLFNTKKSCVQLFSGSMANLIVIISLFREKLRTPAEANILSTGLGQKGYLSHGSPSNISGMLFFWNGGVKCKLL